MKGFMTHPVDVTFISLANRGKILIMLAAKVIVTLECRGI
jgi:hypothetical protein